MKLFTQQNKKVGTVLSLDKMKNILLFVFLIFTVEKTYGQAAGGNQLIILPLFGYSDEQGIGIGANAAWLGISGGTWDANTALYASTLFGQFNLSGDITNKKLFDFLYVNVGGMVYKGQRSLYYGAGNLTDIKNVTQFSITDQSLYTRVGVTVYPSVIAGVGLIYRSTSIDRGADLSLPQYLDTYPIDPHKSGTTNTATTVFLQYDTRTSLAPQEGQMAYISWDQDQPWFNGDLSLQRLSLEALKLWPVSDKTLIVLTRFKHEHEWGNDVPFFLKSRIGGVSSLRGYKANRYTDNASQVFNIEPRWTFWTPGGNLVQRFDLSLAYEFGRVFNYETIPPVDSYHTDWDLGLTAVLPSGLPIRLDYAVGPESTLFYLHLFQPF